MRFLGGRKTGLASRPVAISTVLRPSEVDVRVQSTTSGAVVRQERMTADYRALGPRQTNCGGDAQGMQFVPGG